jgi:hypothetical protein
MKGDLRSPRTGPSRRFQLRIGDQIAQDLLVGLAVLARRGRRDPADVAVDDRRGGGGIAADKGGDRRIGLVAREGGYDRISPEGPRKASLWTMRLSARLESTRPAPGSISRSISVSNMPWVAALVSRNGRPGSILP